MVVNEMVRGADVMAHLPDISVEWPRSVATLAGKRKLPEKEIPSMYSTPWTVAAVKCQTKGSVHFIAWLFYGEEREWGANTDKRDNE